MEFAISISQPTMVRLPWNLNYTYQLDFKPSGFTLAMCDLEFSGQGTRIFMVKIWISYISSKNGLFTTKENQTYRLNPKHQWHRVWPWSSPWKVRCKVVPYSDRGDFRCHRAIDSSSLYMMLVSTAVVDVEEKRQYTEKSLTYYGDWLIGSNKNLLRMMQA